jgi:hypothetical protein
MSLDPAADRWEGVQVTDFAPRTASLAGQAVVVFAGALVPLVLIALAGGDGSLGWVALAGGAACASGLMLGFTERLLPALALAVIAAAALALAAAASQNDAAEERAFPAAAAAADDSPRTDAVAAPEGEKVLYPADGAAAAATIEPLTRAAYVRRHYEDLEAGRFDAAWASLPQAARDQAGSLDAWRAGYETTLSQRVENVRLEPGGFVRHDLVAVDRTPCGTTTERRYEVLWRLSPAAGDLTASYLEAVQLAGVDPELAC